ncbi:hypothetical protein HYPSUDRAFT_71250 [Hypholoma sublateritium FD-334 SS-4]|uniref:NB-ARC domain-containing protein n=1 Tax=Hypholoma sublateritium (strain FD-334 SS-4) TaxID=945553 RepID=A0A0D2NBR7_HYPSF|nr:hypothetical protein HYPSUDRAFT_71250 [Hypholoma sublateritium FD-334 SS-4]
MQASTSRGSLGSVAGNDGSQQLDTIVAIVNEVGKLLGHLPYIQPLGRIIVQFVRIRNEIKTNRERCQEVIANVLRKSEMLYKRLLAIGQSPHRDRLSHLENILINYQSTLSAVYKTLQANSSSRSKSFLRTFTGRTADDINQCERLVDSLQNDILFDIVIDIKIEQVGSPNKSELYPSSILASPAPSIASSTVFTHTLPPKPKLMVERDGILNNMINMLLGENPSRIAILGGQGFGKTTCSLFALHDSRIAERFANRFYLSCESITNAQSLLVGIAHMLGISSSKSWSNLIPSIRHFLQGAKTLICLDNFESPWEELSTRQKVEDALASISAIENLSLVVNVKGKERPASVDWTWPPLPPLDKISLSGAESIVRDIAGIQAVDQYTHYLLEAVEGIPLAITLISNLLRDGAETSSSLWRRWSYKERRQNSMMGGVQNEESSQTSKIDAAIAISINSPQMKKYLDASNILATLSLLPDGFSSDDKHLLELQTFLKTSDIHKCLDTLQNLGLLRIDEAVIPHRIRVLSPIELYCHKFLASEISTVSEELTNYYISKMIEIGLPTSSLNAEHTIEMEMEIRNIHSLFRRKYISKNITDADLAKFVKTSYFLGLWSIQMGYMLDDILELAIASSPQLPIPRARCRLAQSSIYREMGRFEDAERLSTLALNDFQTFDDLKGQEEALAAMASIFRSQGRNDLSTSTLLQSKELNILYLKRRDIEKETQSGFKALETFKAQSGIAPHHIAYIYIKLGIPSVYMDEARLESALNYLHRAQDIYSQMRHAMGEATALFHIGYGYLLQNQLSSARRMVENGRTLCPAISSQISKGEIPPGEGMIFSDQTLEPEMQAVFLTLLAHICIREDRLSEAKALLKKAIKKKNKYSVTPKIKLGWLYIQQNRSDKAETVLSDVLEQCREWKYTEEESEVLAYQGIIQLRRGNLEQADEALKLSRGRGLVLYSEVDVVKALADVSIQKGDLKVAEELLKHAMYVQKHINSAFGQGNVLRSTGDLYLHQKKFSEALDSYQEARRLHKVAQWVSEEVRDVAGIATVHERQGNLTLEEEAHAEVRRLRKLIP